MLFNVRTLAYVIVENKLNLRRLSLDFFISQIDLFKRCPTLTITSVLGAKERQSQVKEQQPPSATFTTALCTRSLIDNTNSRMPNALSHSSTLALFADDVLPRYKILY